MRELAHRALNQLQLQGASYGDVRLIEQESQVLMVKNGQVVVVSHHRDQGMGLRVIVDGAWGFASSAELSTAEVDRIAGQAVSIARASARVRLHPIDLGRPEVHQGSYQTPVTTDPFGVSVEEKLALLAAAEAGLRQSPRVRSARADLEFIRTHKLFLSTEGSHIEQTLVESGGGLECLAVEGSEVQKRSYPNAFGRHQKSAGWEFIQQLELVEAAPRVAEEAIALLTAPPCPPGVTTVILDATQVALQLHESCGHPIELDRVFGDEAAFAGTSFLTTDKLDTYRYGSPQVNISADATIPGGVGTFGWDDEGVPAQRVPIVRQGILVGYLSGRESAQRLGRPSGGAMRASSWNRIPLVRMTNVNLEPGDWSLEDLIADTDDGLYLETNRSWSIDDRRLNFQFGTEIAREIKGGRLGRLYKNALYTGITPQFWAGCDAVCNADHWQVWGTVNCGKGQPAQVAHVGHGTTPARFQNVQVSHVHS